MGLDQEYMSMDEHVRKLIQKIQKAAAKGKGVRLTAFDCECLNSTVFLEDIFFLSDDFLEQSQ